MRLTTILILAALVYCIAWIVTDDADGMARCQASGQSHDTCYGMMNR